MENFINKKPNYKRTSYHWRRRWHQLRELDHTSLKTLLQVPSTNMDQTNPSNQTTHQSSWCMQTPSIRSILTEEDILPFLQDTQDFFPSASLDMSIPDHQPFRLKLLHSLLLISDDPDPNIATLLQEGIPSGAFSQLQPVGLWEPNSKTSSYAMRTGPVQTRTLKWRVNWFKKNSTTASLKSYQTSWQLNSDGPKVLHWEN